MRNEILEAIRHLMNSIIFLPKDTPRVVIQGLLNSLKELISIYEKLRD